MVYFNPGSGLSNSLPFLVNYPIPTLVSLSPDSKLVDSSTFTLTIDGLGFASTSLVQWEENSLVTTWISPTRLSTVVPASYLNNVNSYAITVLNPEPEGGVSIPLPFEVQNHVPDLSSMNPISTTVGSTNISLTLSGVNFIAESVVRWEGDALVTTYVSPTQLTAVVPASLFLQAGVFSLVVENPSPSLGPSQHLPFTVRPGQFFLPILFR